MRVPPFCLVPFCNFIYASAYASRVFRARAFPLVPHNPARFGATFGAKLGTEPDQG